MHEFFSPDTLGTFSGCALVTGMITQLLKNVLKKLPTQWLSFIIALTLLFIFTAADGFCLAWKEWAALPINAALVSLSSNGAYSAAVRLGSGLK